MEKTQIITNDSTAIQHEENGNFDRSWRDEQWGDRKLSVAAANNAAEVKDMTIREALRDYSPALMWSFIISMIVIMEGYDTNLLGNFFAYPSFQIKFGTFIGKSSTSETGYRIPAAWQAAVGQAAGIGSFFGTLLNGYLVAKFGTKKVVIGALFVMSAVIFIPFFAPSLPVLLVGQILNGFPWGIFATSAPAYASEILPTPLRTYMTSWTNMCFILGQLISAGILKGLSTRDDSWGYRIPFAIQWIWPVFLIPAVYIAPESPWYLVRQNRLDEAEQSLERLKSKKATHIDVKKTLAEIIFTNNLEEQLSVGTSYWDCFKGFELRRTEIACMCFIGQITSGICFAYNSSFFFQAIGLSTSTTYSLALGGTALAFVGCIVNWVALMPYFGRRTIYVVGMLAMSIILIIIGIMNVKTSVYSVALAQACLTLLWTFVFQLSAGQLGWALPAEMGSTRLRQKTICLARNACSLAGVVGGTLNQYMMSAKASGGWEIRGYTGFVWGGAAFLTFVWAYFRLPETWNRSFHELDVLFAKRVPARKFATTKVDSFDEHQANELAQRYSVADATRRPSFIPSISAKVVKDPVEIAQRRASVTDAGHPQRRSSIAEATTIFADKHNLH